MNKKPTYEQAMKRLQTIVSQMENGEMDIDSLLANLKEAKQLIDFCRNKLTQVETDVKKILEE
ncbi:MAG: exodeoxyribonuclease VII small subunit [Bacteroidaceae bacterium]|jgi:exodeoxyribonuclease VII small subunit|nr:exodeoxyribonuclease VII small subunit [Bacteroidaceae bacterium]